MQRCGFFYKKRLKRKGCKGIQGLEQPKPIARWVVQNNPLTRRSTSGTFASFAVKCLF
jgi:hypothetical protein